MRTRLRTGKVVIRPSKVLKHSTIQTANKARIVALSRCSLAIRVNLLEEAIPAIVAAIMARLKIDASPGLVYQPNPTGLLQREGEVGIFRIFSGLRTVLVVAAVTAIRGTLHHICRTLLHPKQPLPKLMMRMMTTHFVLRRICRSRTRSQRKQVCRLLGRTPTLLRKLALLSKRSLLLRHWQNHPQT